MRIMGRSQPNRGGRMKETELILSLCKEMGWDCE